VVFPRNAQPVLTHFCRLPDQFAKKNEQRTTTRLSTIS